MPRKRLNFNFTEVFKINMVDGRICEVGATFAPREKGT
jgi:hypothetical protein